MCNDLLSSSFTTNTMQQIAVKHGLSVEEYQKILSIPDDYKVLCACVFGYRSSDDKYASLAKVRFDKSDIIDYK
jgi:hypothetical protein